MLWANDSTHRKNKIELIKHNFTTNELNKLNTMKLMKLDFDTGSLYKTKWRMKDIVYINKYAIRHR